MLFIVWANFVSSLLYLFAVYGFIESKKWTAPLLGFSVIGLLLVYFELFIHINAGGIYETKTIGAMAFRTTVTLVFSALAYFTITKNIKQ